jgi:GntR family transcriptional regulator
MDLSPDNPVLVRRRLLLDTTTHRPEELGASYIPAEIAAGTHLAEPVVVPKALFLCIEDLTGKRYAHARDLWVSRLPTAEEADLLDLPTGAPVLNVIHIARADDDTLLEVSESVWPADRVMLVDDYDIDQDAAEPITPSEV